MIDDYIFSTTPNGGIARFWRKVKPALEDLTNDVFISTYYQAPPQNLREIVVFYDPIVFLYPAFRNRWDVPVIRSALERASHVIAISRWSASYAKQLTDAPVSVVYPAFDCVEPVWLNLPDAFYLMVGNRDHYKNARAFYQAFEMLDNKLPVVIVGGNPTADDMAFGKKHLLLHYNLSDAQLAYAYQKATALVYPSFYEGFGYPVLEALSYGCPVVTSQGGALGEVGGGAVTYIDPHRPQTIADALNRLPIISKEVMRKQASRFTWDGAIERIKGVL